MQDPPATPPVTQSPPEAAAPLRQEELMASVPVRQMGEGLGSATFPAKHLPLEAILPLAQPDWAMVPLRQVCPAGEPPVLHAADKVAASALAGPKPSREGRTYGFFFFLSDMTYTPGI